MKLDEQLQNIRRIEQTPEECMNAQKKIEIAIKPRRVQLTPLFVSGAMLAIMLFLVFISPVIQQSQHTASEQAILKKVTILDNHKPKKLLNLNSINYIEKVEVTDAQNLMRVTNYFSDILQNGVQWDGEIQEKYPIKEMQLTYSGGGSDYYKLIRGDESFVIDVNNKVKYLVPEEIEELLFDFVYEEYNGESKLLKFILCAFIFLFLFAITDHFTRKKYGLKDENGKQKNLPFVVFIFIYLLYLVPLMFGEELFGTVHFGVVLVCFVIAFVATYEFQKRLKIQLPNPYFYRIMFPGVILGLVIIYLIIV